MSPDEHIIDALIFGSNSKHTQTKLLEKDAILTLVTALDIARKMKSKAIKSRGLQPIILLELMLLNVARLLLMQQIHPANPVAPSFVYVDAVILNLIFLSDP